MIKEKNAPIFMNKLLEVVCLKIVMSFLPCCELVLIVKSLSCSQLVALRERTFFFNKEQIIMKYGALSTSRLDLDIWVDNGQGVRRKDLPKKSNSAFIPVDHILQ